MSSEDIFAIEDEFIQKIEQGIRSAERLFSMIDVEEDCFVNYLDLTNLK